MDSYSMLKAGITLERVWFDDDLLEFRVIASDGESQFCVQAYVGHREFAESVAALERFKTHVHGGVYDFCLGNFGPEYASGALQARFHFPQPERLYITLNAESDWEEFGVKSVASAATLYLKTEPGLLDNFVEDLKKLNTTDRPRAYLECLN